MAKKTAKTTQERRTDRLRIETAKKSLKEQLELVDLMLKDGQVEDAPDETVPDVDVLEKHGEYYPEVAMPIAGPTSFEELDAAKEARHQAHEINEASWDAQDLVRNILNHPIMDAKGKATAIKGVGSGFEKRISGILSEPMTMKKDLDVLSIESILAHDKRNTNFFEQIVDKAKLVMSGEGTTSYSIADKAHTRAALAWAAKEIADGGDGAVLAKESMPEIRAAAKKFGIEMTMKKDRNAIVIEKDNSGSWRWIGWVSNNFIDTDKDIISEVAHKEYVAYLDENPQMAPPFLTWHTPGTTREALPDFWTYENGFLIMSGQLTEKEAEVLLKASQLTDLGMSHGTLVFSRDKKDPRVITKYRMYEESDLPLENAANPFTAIETLSKEADMNKLEYLAGFVGKERAEELIKQTETAQSDLTAAGVISKEATPPPATVTTAVPAKVVPDHVMKEIGEYFGFEDLSAFVTQAKQDHEEVGLLKVVVKELSKSDDEKLAEKISPPIISAFSWMEKERPSGSDKNILGENDQLLKAKPETGWLSEATGTKPIPQTA